MLRSKQALSTIPKKKQIVILGVLEKQGPESRKKDKNVKVLLLELNLSKQKSAQKGTQEKNQINTIQNYGETKHYIEFDNNWQ